MAGANVDAAVAGGGNEPRALRATYRLQLTPEFGFVAAQERLPYLAALGISHLYLSPSLQARRGSTHGYDVCDPAQISQELGGEDAFRELAAAAHAAGMGIILDVVPNHMAASDENRFWADPQLRERFFDVDPVTGRWRRFFDVDDLAAIRIEDPEVFEATHAKVISLVTEGLVDGLRVDHPDGLADPAGYLQRLRERGVDRVWVEKILGAEERLPDDWPVSGTVGYDFLNDLIGISVNPVAEPAFSQLWAEIAGDPRPFGAWAFDAKLEQATGTFAPEVERLGREYTGDPRVHQADGVAAPGALAAALAAQPLYRSYIPPSSGPFLTRFQQTSPAIMAKGVEDTAFYRYARLIALNEVGGEPGRWHLPVAAFHAHNAERALQYPEALLTTMTHDAKRSADARARVVALTWFPDEWLALVRRWITFASPDPALTEPDPIDRYFILQTLIGVWPIEWERIDGYLEKALRESKRHSNWIEPDLAYEDGAKAWARALMEHGDFHVEFRRLLAAVEHLGYAISTAWIALKILCPGVPDIYQGDELAYRALVDPDNRRPVDWDARAAALADRGGADIKMSTILSLLELRRAHPDAFGPHGTYRAIDLGDAAIGFGRGDAVEVRIGLSATSGFSVQVHETL